MAINFTNLSAALNKVIMPSIRNQFFERAPLWQLIGGWSAEKRDPAYNNASGSAERANVNVARFENNKMYIPIRSSGGSGVVGVGISERYVYGESEVSETYQEIRTIVGSFTIPKQLINVTNAGAIVKPLMFQTEGLSYDMARDANRQVYGDGSGRVGRLSGAVANLAVATTLTFKASVNGTTNYTRFVPKGTRISVNGVRMTTGKAVSGPVAGSHGGIVAVTVDAGQSATAGADGDAVVKITGDYNPSSDIDGLEALVDDDTAYQNYDPADDAMWAAHVYETAETISKTNIRNKINTAFLAASATGRPTWAVMGITPFQLLGETLEEKVQQSPGNLVGGWQTLSYGSLNILLDPDCPDDRIYFLSMEDIVFGVFQDFEFEKGTDGQLLKLVQQLDYEVTASWMGNIGTTARNAHAVLSNKTFSFA